MDIRNLIRTILNEVTLADHRAFEALSDKIIRLLAEENIANVQNFLTSGGYREVFPKSIFLARFKQDEELLSSSPLLKQLVYTMSDLSVSLQYSFRKERGGGSYGKAGYLGMIKLYFNDEFLEELKEREILSETMLFVVIRKEFGVTLVHELRHAMDDNRSRGKYIKTPEFTEFKKSHGMGINNIPPSTDKKAWLNYMKAYLPLPHEVWARFAEFVYRTRMKEVDYNTQIVAMPDGRKGIIYKIDSLNNVVFTLKKQLDGWEMLGEKTQRRLINAISNLWHQENEWAMANNKNVLAVSKQQGIVQPMAKS